MRHPRDSHFGQRFVGGDGGVEDYFRKPLGVAVAVLVGLLRQLSMEVDAFAIDVRNRDTEVGVSKTTVMDTLRRGESEPVSARRVGQLRSTQTWARRMGTSLGRT